MLPKEFRAIGHSLVDAVADFLTRLPDAPTASSLLPDAMRTKLGRREMPENGTDIAPVIEKFSQLFFDQSTHNGSPRFFGYITSSAAPVGALADLLAAAVNPNCGAWALSPIATEIENECIRWLSQFMGLTGNWDGVVYHTYSAFARGVDALWGMYQWLDRAPKGRNETGMWWRRHDEYDKR